MQENSQNQLSPALYVVATPIGNLQDITLRAINVLKNCDYVVCEDSRVTGKLLEYLEIKKPYIVYNDHSDNFTREKVLNFILQGKSLALVSDAGTPLISDPGYKLINFIKENNCNVLSVPGACSPIAALSVSGMASDRFMFVGFIPHNSKETFFKDLVLIKSTLIFFESPNRLVESLKTMLEIFGDRTGAVAREITKIYEEVKKDNLSNLISYYEQNPPKGEIVILLSGPSKKDEIDFDLIDQRIRQGFSKMKPKDLAAIIADEFKVSKKEIYQRILDLIK